MTAEQITRPNGKPYRRRKPVTVEVYYSSNDAECVIVIGTHDLDAAAALAEHMWEHDEPLPEGRRRWLRLVPWDTGGGYDRSWIDDPARGTAVVTFDPEDVTR